MYLSFCSISFERLFRNAVIFSFVWTTISWIISSERNNFHESNGFVAVLEWRVGPGFLRITFWQPLRLALIGHLEVHSILFSACPFFFGSRRPVRSVSSEKSSTGSKLDSSNALSIELTSRFVEYVILGRIGMTSCSLFSSWRLFISVLFMPLSSRSLSEFLSESLSLKAFSSEKSSPISS